MRLAMLPCWLVVLRIARGDAVPMTFVTAMTKAGEEQTSLA
jgi:hypothetical protein